MPDAVAIWFAAPREVQLRREAVAMPPGSIRVAAEASGISAGSELLVYRGEAPRDLPPDLPTVAGGFGLPMKFGYASVGRVVETAPGVHRPAVGDLVFAHHPHQSEYVVDASLPVILPPDLAPEVGVFTANLETAVTVVLDAQPRFGEEVLILGQGVVGLLVTMLLVRAGARVIAADAYERRRGLSLRLGAERAVSPERDLSDTVRAVTGGRGADVVIEASGNPAALQAGIDSVAFGGTVVVASWYGARPASLDLGRAFHRRRVRIVSSQVSTLDPALSSRWTHERRTGLVMRLLTELPLAELISHRFPLHAAPDAYELLDRDPGEAVQVVFTYDGAPGDGAR
ncbi:MAG TPA: zinc-binding alcohol dehydrogenase [Candidatus Limnocylindria bacterium]|nr:zinc-binding alcohol dehydrogenase [Candidatus Limnocylindria bacterium]